MFGIEDAPFVITPGEPAGPLIIEIPHAGLVVDARSAIATTTQVRCLALDADLYVDELFAEATTLGATLLSARLSRHVIDFNTAPELGLHDLNVDEPERRIIYRRIPGEQDSIIERPVPRAERARRLTSYFEPYHRALRELVDERRTRFGSAVLLCAHSWDDREERRPVDLVIGARGGTSASPRVIEKVEAVARELDLTTRRDVPFSGGYTVAHYGHPSEGVHALQIEIARRLYVDADTLVPKSDGVARLRQLARRLVEVLNESHAIGEPNPIPL